MNEFLLNHEMMDETPPDTPPVTPPATPPPSDPVPTRTDILRDLSKEYGVNLFDAEGIKQFKEFTESQKTDLQKAQEAIDTFTKERETWQAKELEYKSKLKASELGIDPSNVEDALKLADNNPDNLAEVVKKYPFLQRKDGIRIGTQDPNNNHNPSGKTEVEQYMEENYANNPYYKKK